MIRVYHDPSESRSGTRLPPNVIASSTALPDLESLTGGDILITVSEQPLGNVSITSLPGQAMLRHAIREGLLSQRKTGADFMSSLKHLDEIERRMREWSSDPNLLVVGRFDYRDGKVTIDGGHSQSNGHSFESVIGALRWWRWRGGSVDQVLSDRYVLKWVNTVGVGLERLAQDTHHRVIRESRQSLGKPGIADVLITFDQIGRERALWLADQFTPDDGGSLLAWVIATLTDPNAVAIFKKQNADGKVVIPPHAISAVREQFGLKPGQQLGVIPSLGEGERYVVVKESIEFVDGGKPGNTILTVTLSDGEQVLVDLPNKGHNQ